jgi:hypothetical protein
MPNLSALPSLRHDVPSFPELSLHQPFGIALTGVSTGVIAPFITGLLKANTPFVLVVVVSSSLLGPFHPAPDG